MNRKRSFTPWKVLELSTGRTIDKGENMKLNELADLHNRRSNIGTVARRCKKHSYPLLAWPEDKALLRLTDLPVIYGKPNKPTTWTDFEYTVARWLNSDEELRDFICVGRAYKIANIAPRQYNGSTRLVVEYRVETR